MCKPIWGIIPGIAVNSDLRHVTAIGTQIYPRDDPQPYLLIHRHNINISSTHSAFYHSLLLCSLITDSQQWHLTPKGDVESSDSSTECSHGYHPYNTFSFLPVHRSARGTDSLALCLSTVELAKIQIYELTDTTPKWVCWNFVVVTSSLSAHSHY